MGTFRIRWQDTVGGAYTSLIMIPQPTGVDYPVRRNVANRVTPDGAVVTQRPLRDDRTRKWFWNRMRDTVPGYSALWAALLALEYRTRLEANKPASVEIFEDITAAGGFGNVTSGPTPVWTKVRIVQVSRDMATGGGSVYEQSSIEFIIDDLNYTGF